MESASLALARPWLGRRVTVRIDRPLGSLHPRWGFCYAVNYGCVPGVIAPDGEELDAYVLGIDEPLIEFTGRCIAIVHRLDDDDDKLVVVPDGMAFTDDEIRVQTRFQEQFFQSRIVRTQRKERWRMANVGSDRGYTFHGPTIADRAMRLKSGLTLEAFHLAGIVVSEMEGSPLHHATLYAQGTTVRDAAGAMVCEACLYEFTGPDGDSAWAIGVNGPSDAEATFRLVQGTGKWEGLAGSFRTLGEIRERADDRCMLGWEMFWQVDKGGAWPYEALVESGVFTDYDTGYSFHGPHVVTRVKELASGQVLSANTQAGVLISETEHSPRHDATCYDRGTTIKTPEGRALGDIMLLEDTDADGDVVWLYHEWWYGKGPGRYEFLGGTGKWAGITGVGRTLGMVCSRADDHYMPTWEMHWKIRS